MCLRFMKIYRKGRIIVGDHFAPRILRVRTSYCFTSCSPHAMQSKDPKSQADPRDQPQAKTSRKPGPRKARPE